MLARLKHAARFGIVKLSDHAQEEAENASAQAKDIENAITTATSVIEQRGKRFRLEGGVDVDGDGLGVVVVEVQYGLYVITVF